MLYRPEYDENGKKVLCEMNGVNSDMLINRHSGLFPEIWQWRTGKIQGITLLIRYYFYIIWIIDISLIGHR